jgi:hypothetical protein
MNGDRISSILLLLPMLMLPGLAADTAPVRPPTDPRPLVWRSGPTSVMAAANPDLGPEGISYDSQGHDAFDAVAGQVTFNNQERTSIHIETIFVQGVNIKTQGRIQIGMDIPPGEKRVLLVIMRDKKGKPSNVSVSVQLQ